MTRWRASRFGGFGRLRRFGRPVKFGRLGRLGRLGKFSRLVKFGRISACGDGGSAIIEFIFVAVLVMVPLVYLIVAVADVQRSSLAVTDAAREAGRAFATSSSTDEGLARAQVAARLALADEGLSESPVIVYVAADAGCLSAPIRPKLQPGAQFTVCVTRTLALPGVPTLLAGHGVTTVGKYIVHVDDYRSVS